MLTTKQIHTILLATQNNCNDIQSLLDSMSKALKSNVYLYDMDGKVLYESKLPQTQSPKAPQYEILDFNYSVAEATFSTQLYNKSLPNNAVHIKSSHILKGTLFIEKPHLTLLEKTLLEMVSGIISISLK